MTEAALPLVVVLPMLGGGLSLAGKLVRPLSPAARVLSLGGIAGSLAVLISLAQPVFSGETVSAALGGWPEPYGIALVMDGFAWITSVLIAGVSLLTAVFALSGGKYNNTFFFFYHLLVAGMFGVALTGDLFTMFVSFEIVAIAAYVIAARRLNRSAQGLPAARTGLFRGAGTPRHGSGANREDHSTVHGLSLDLPELRCVPWRSRKST